MNGIQLPSPLMTSDPGSFARSTIEERAPQIIAQVAEANPYPPAIQHALQALAAEIATAPMQPLREEAADVPDWNTKLEHYRGRTWLQVPWYWAETLFYRKLLEAVQYFQAGPWLGHDPFDALKRTQEAVAVAHFDEGWIHLADAVASLDRAIVFEALLHSALWGNRADLSNLTVREPARAGLATQHERENLLIDDTGAVYALMSAGLPQVTFINDNVGLDLLFDLALADFLLNQGWTQQVVFHLKDRPFFVSDAMPVDVGIAIGQLQQAPGAPTRTLGRRLEERLKHDQLALRTDPFWTSYRTFRDMPLALYSQLGQAGLVVVKGDVNYRRLLDDRHWPPTTRMEAVTTYFPAPFVALRTLKGEIMVGLAPGQAEQLAAEDPAWLINGKRGVIHLVA